MFSVMRKQHQHHSDAHDNNMVNQVQEVIDEDPSRSMRKIPRDIRGSAST